MPRRRTIGCENCRHLLLRNADYCEFCHCVTRRGRRRWSARVVGLAMTLAGSAALYALIRGFNFP